jgi:predicted short-subunit dehydrogenase-like oxidoreductase (DUF2520 family)
LGASLAIGLGARGLILAGFTASSPGGRERAERWLGRPALPTLSDVVANRSDIYFICVPDSAVESVAAHLGEELRSSVGSADVGGARPVVVHTSGATSVSALVPCEAAGAAALVFHPLQTFPEPLAGAARFRGSGVALTPGPCYPDEAGTTGIALAEILEMRPFFLADDKRSLYHAAASVACNYLVTLEHLADGLFAKAGVPERVTLSLFLPLVQATLDNLAVRGPRAALTGPLSRGDVGTVKGHLEALATDAPEVLPVYRALGLATLDLVITRGEVSPRVVAELRRLLTGTNEQ